MFVAPLSRSRPTIHRIRWAGCSPSGVLSQLFKEAVKVTRPIYTAPMSADEKERFVPFMHELIDAAWAVIGEKFLTGVHVDDKANGTPVTEADRGAELVMRALIEARFPEHGIFGEEYGVREADDGAVRYRWILDPIDGTRSFITNSFLFGTLVALERDAGEGYRPILSSISHAAAGVRAIGTREAGTLIVKNAVQSFERPLRVRPCASIADATLLATSHWTTGEQKGTESMQRLIDRAHLYRTMGDCFGYFAVASGGADIMVDPDLSYWDLAALVPVVEGAGGVITSATGGNPFEELSAVCTAGGVHDEVLAILKG